MKNLKKLLPLFLLLAVLATSCIKDKEVEVTDDGFDNEIGVGSVSIGGRTVELTQGFLTYAGSFANEDGETFYSFILTLASVDAEWSQSYYYYLGTPSEIATASVTLFSTDRTDLSGIYSPSKVTGIKDVKPLTYGFNRTLLYHDLSDYQDSNATKGTKKTMIMGVAEDLETILEDATISITKDGSTYTFNFGGKTMVENIDIETNEGEDEYQEEEASIEYTGSLHLIR